MVNIDREKNFLKKTRIILAATLILPLLAVMLFFGFDSANLDITPHSSPNSVQNKYFDNFNAVLSLFPKTVTPNTFSNLFYKYNPSLNGKGERIAIIENTADYNPDGIKEFDKTFSLPDVDVSVYSAGSPVASGNPLETMTDLELIHMLAPYSKVFIIQWDGKSNEITSDVNRIKPDAISLSIGSFGHLGMSHLRLPFFCGGWDVFRHYNSFVASGDNGAGIDFPAALESVVSVGGVSFSPTEPLDYAHMDGWSDSTGGYAFWARSRPAWQAGNKSIWRGIPDVSFLAGWPGYAVCADKQKWTVEGGTSVAAPIIAAAWALGDEKYFETHQTHIPPFAPQIIYNLHAQNPNVFVQARTGGNNGQYRVTNSWNPVTGLGVPDLSKFITAISNYQQITYAQTTNYYLDLWSSLLALALVLIAFIFIGYMIVMNQIFKRKKAIMANLISSALITFLFFVQLVVGGFYGYVLANLSFTPIEFAMLLSGFGSMTWLIIFLWEKPIRKRLKSSCLS